MKHKFGVVLLFLFVLSSCGETVEIASPAKQECEDILIQYRDDVGKWIVWWLPDLDPTHTGAIVYHNGEPVRNACFRNSDLKLSETGAWSIFVSEGDMICVDYDSRVTPDDFECCSYAE